MNRIAGALRWLHLVSVWVEQQPVAVWVVFAVVYWLGLSWIAAAKLMWFDELVTYYPARQPAWADVWRYFAEGRDVHTPVSAWLMRLSLSLFGDSHWSLRFPYLCGYFLMVTGCGCFVARRAGVLWGLVAASFPLTSSTIYYATEARPYALMMGMAAWAAVAWQALGEKRARPWWLMILGGSLAFAISLHFFAVFLTVPLILAEWTRWRERGRRDWMLAAVLLLSPAAYLPFLPGILKGRAIYGGTYWSRPGLASAEESYRYFLTLALFPFLLAMFIWAVTQPLLGKESGENSESRQALHFPREEWVLLTAWCLLPVLMVGGAFFLGAYVPRYALPTMGGLAVLLAVLAWLRSGNNRWLGLVMSAVFLAWFAYKSQGTARRELAKNGAYPRQGRNAFATKRWFTAARESRLPLVVTPAVFFVQLQHYSEEAVSRRMVYLTQREHARDWDGTDTGDLGLLNFAIAAPYRIEDYGKFLNQETEFLILADTTAPTWHLEQLRRDGRALRLLVRDGAQSLFVVGQPQAMPPSEK
ncbi:glycosyltransferase family 39 protein [Nostoc sp. NIES-2111]